MTNPDTCPPIEKYAQRPVVADAWVRFHLHLANARASSERTKRLIEEQERFESALYAAYLKRRRLFGF